MALSPLHIWATIGVILIIADVFTMTFFLFFLGIGALITAGCVWIGATKTVNSQLLCFAVSSLVTMVFFRGIVKKMFGKRKGDVEYSQLTGQKAYVSSAIPAGREGKVSYRGSEWIAFSDSPDTIPEGSLVTIVNVEGIKLKVAE